MQRYADLEVIIQRMADGGHAVDLRFRADAGDLDRDLALNVPITIAFAPLIELLNDAQQYGAALARMIFGDQRLREGWITARAATSAQASQLMPLLIEAQNGTLSCRDLLRGARP
ncbi:MAG: hypothetical protein AB4911_05790 [Oscillochloridaceae bacterium umkhey_bin13]